MSKEYESKALLALWKAAVKVEVYWLGYFDAIADNNIGASAGLKQLRQDVEVGISLNDIDYLSLCAQRCLEAIEI